MASEYAMVCSTSTDFDCKTVEARSQHEGFSFLTITLSNFGKDFEKSLDQGYVDRNLFQGFSWKGGLPRFLGGFLDLVFDRNGGALLSDPAIDAILAVRQLSLLFGKILLPCSDARVAKAMKGYLECEQDIKQVDNMLSKSDILDFRRVASLLFVDSFTAMDREVYNGELIPRHGPGATADGLRGNAKYNQRSWPSRLERILSSSDFLIPNYSYYGELDRVDILEPGSEVPVRVISVPKTLKTPRIIGVEPTAMQYAQQSVLPVILKNLMKDDFLRSALGFSDQRPNQMMAAEGSLTGSLATLDLSEASDRVSNQQVRDLFHYHPNLLGVVDATRSRKADVPGHGVIRLSKFASMGSALCFPVEAMVFLTLVCLGIERELRAPLTRKKLQNLMGRVRIYGDDIIIPVEYVQSVVSVLSTFGSKVNVGKSFWTGKFRESCGKEYYDGNDVSIVKCRRVFPTRRTDVPELISLVSFRNQLYKAGLWKTCKWLDERIRKLIKFPVVAETSQALGRHSFLGYQVERVGGRYQRPLVKANVIAVKAPQDHLEGPGALLKVLLIHARRELSPRENPLDYLTPQMVSDHLERTGRDQAVALKLGWVQPF